jgi:hypothetical protein
MRSLYESILSSTGSGKSRVLRGLLKKEPKLEQFEELKKLWSELELDLPKCTWTILSRSDGKSYAYVTNHREYLIITNFCGFTDGTKNVISDPSMGFYTSVCKEKEYKKWQDKIKTKLNIKIENIPLSSWQELIF